MSERKCVLYFEVKPIESGLHIVSMPIGRARDITLNASDVLASVDVIVAEDTRMIKKILNIYEIPKRKLQIISYHDYNAKAQIPKILKHIYNSIYQVMVSKLIALDLSIMYGKWSTWELTAPYTPTILQLNFRINVITLKVLGIGILAVGLTNREKVVEVY